MRSPVSGSVPGRIDPSERKTAGWVVLQHGRQRADGRLVARDDRDQAADLVGGQMSIDRIVRDLTPDEGEAHPVGCPFSWPSDTPTVNTGGTSRTGRSSRRMRAASAAWIASTFRRTPT
jgi:hypothetical protein